MTFAIKYPCMTDGLILLRVLYISIIIFSWIMLMKCHGGLQYTRPQQRKKEESDKLRRERDQI